YVRWLYLAICVPHILYSAEVWLVLAHQREKGKDGCMIVKRLTLVQLQATRLIVGGIVSSPGDMLDVHADLPPMNL
ncbi:hypothetical protein B0H17DRAFT_850223, partial [Mycena rosella]